MSTILFVGIGGGIGAICRFLLLQFFNIFITSSTSVSMMCTNLVGCFLYGMISETYHSVLNFHSYIYALLSTGIVGGFTAFSSFTIEAMTIFESGRTYTGVCYVLFSILLCFSGFYLGKSLIRFLFV